MEKDLVSIIIPLFNSEGYLKRCIESAVNQTYSNTEIILIDDGSTDNSGSICKSFINKNNNIKYIYQDNSGVSAARNKGIEVSSGKYIMFLDADDYLCENSVEVLYSVLVNSNSDVVDGGIHKTVFNSNVHFIIPDNSINGFEACIVEMTKKYTLNQVCGKLLRSVIIKSNRICFDEYMASGEDLDFMCRYLLHCNVISLTSEIIYNYIIASHNSLSQRFKPNYFEQISKSFQSLEKLYKSKDMIDKYGDVIYSINAQNIWAGFFSINAKNCTLSLNEKISFVKSGLNSDCYFKYKKNIINSFSKVKKTIMNIKSPFLLTVVIIIMGKIRK